MIDKALTLHIQDGDNDLAPDSANPLRFEKEVAYVGDFAKWKANGELEYRFSIDEKDIDHWIEQHNAQINAGIEVVMPEEHTTAPSARRATALKLSKRVDSKGRLGIFVLGEFKDADSQKALKASQVSLYCPPQFKHGNSTFTRPIRHIAFTDNPVIGGLDPLTTLAASYVQEKSKMRKLAESLGLKLSDDLTDDQIRDQIQAHYESLKNTGAGAGGSAGKSVAQGAGSGGSSHTATTIAASATSTTGPSESELRLHRDNREMKIDKLVTERKATPAEAKKLKERWAGTELSLSTEACTAFDDILASYADREPIREGSGQSRSGVQTFDSAKNNALAKAAARYKKPS